MKDPVKDAQFKVRFIMDHASKLNDWENQFVESISSRLDRNIPLSEKQEEVLDRIWEKT